MNTNKAFIYIMKQTDIIPSLYITEYDSYEMLRLINNYSIESGATITKKTYLGRMFDDENRRVISCEKKEQKSEVLGKETITVYEHKILENEKKFIRTLINSFKSCNHNYTGPYTLIDFSEIYEMFINNELNEKDIDLFIEVLNQIKFAPVKGSLFHEQLPGSGTIKRIDAKKI